MYLPLCQCLRRIQETFSILTSETPKGVTCGHGARKFRNSNLRSPVAFRSSERFALRPQPRSDPLRDHQRRQVRVGARNHRHDRRVSDVKVLDAVDGAPFIHHPH